MDLILGPEELISIAILVGVVALIPAWVIGHLLWRWLVPLKPIPLTVEAWRRFEQRRWSEFAKAPRQLLSFGIGVALISGTVAVPWLLGVADGPGWYVNEWWLALFFGAVMVGIVCAWLIAGRIPDRCPRCHSTQLQKAMDGSTDTWIYVCSACAIVWRTRYSTRSQEHQHIHHHH